MIKQRVTTEALRNMRMGEEVTFELPDATAVNTGKSIAYRVQYEMGCRFKAVSDFVNNRLTLTKCPAPERHDNQSTEHK